MFAKATTPSRRKITTLRPNYRRERARENNKERRSRRTDKRHFGMKALIDRIDWAQCLKCNNNNWDDCVQYAMEAAEYGVIGCEYLVINDENGGNDSHDGTDSPS